MMKKYVGPMGYMEPQDQPGNCFECGMKLLEMQTKQTSRRLGGLDTGFADLTQAMQKNISAKSSSYSAKSALLEIAASLNQYSQHFIAQGILEKPKEEKMKF
jgi:hypothetical protein